MKRIVLFLILFTLSLQMNAQTFDCIQGCWGYVSLSEDDSDAETIYLVINGYDKLDLYKSKNEKTAMEEHIVLVKNSLLENDYSAKPLNKDSKISLIEDKSSNVGVFVSDLSDGYDPFGTNGRLGSGALTAWTMGCDNETMDIYKHTYGRMESYSYEFLSLIRDMSIKKLKNYVLKYLKFDLALPQKNTIEGIMNKTKALIAKKDVLKVMKVGDESCQVEVWSANGKTFQCEVAKKDVIFLNDYIIENK